MSDQPMPMYRVERTTRRGDVPMIGWREWVALPGLHVDCIKAKIDTGARTSAIHAFNVVPFDNDGVPSLTFDIHPVQKDDQIAVGCTAPIKDQRLVRSSNGQEELRYIIEAEAALGDTRWMIELSLTDRDQMGFRLLLGRQALKRRFLVDPGRSYLIGRSFADQTFLKIAEKSSG